MSDSQHLHALFLAGLAVAGCASGAPVAKSATESPTSTPTVSSARPSASASPVALPDEHDKARAIAREFRSVADISKAFPGVEHLAAVNTVGMSEPFSCSPSPCTKEWTSLARAAGGSGAVIRRNGKLEYVLHAQFSDKLGVIDTPEKAALWVQFYDETKLATCADLKSLGVECATGSDDAGAAVRKVEGGFEVATRRYINVCSPPSSGGGEGVVFAKVTADGDSNQSDHELSKLAEHSLRAALGPKLTCKPGMLGRMFEGFEDLGAARSELEYYLRAQRQEAAAVVAFERLAVELAAHDAPCDLVASVRRAAREERRHAALFRREATRLFRELELPVEFPAPNTPETFAIRPLVDILRENIAEGCANETYSAVVATYQAERAPNARLRAVFAAIAADERGHAALAHRIHAWGLGVVGPSVSRELRAELLLANARLHEQVEITALGLSMGEPEPALALIAFDHVSQAIAA